MSRMPRPIDARRSAAHTFASDTAHRRSRALLTLAFLAPFAVWACSPETGEGTEAEAAVSGGTWAQIGLPVAQSGGDDVTGPYDLVADWPQNPCGEGYTIGSVGGVFAETADRVYVFMRGCLKPAAVSTTIVPTRNAAGFDLTAAADSMHPKWENVVTVYDRTGKVVESWNDKNDMFVRPHRVRINPADPEKHVWLIDDGAHSIYKFTHAGELVMKLGEFKVPGNDSLHFNRPTDVAWMPNGDFFVSDGYNNTRVVKFDKDGKFLLQWGEPGEAGTEKRPNHFNTVHGVAVDKQHRVYVLDRANHRVQIFDAMGKYLSEFYARFPYSMEITADDHIWIGDGQTNKMIEYDLNGRVLYSWGTFGNFPGGIWGPHQFSVDNENNLYIADVHNGRVQKFTPKAGVNAALLVGQRPAR
jgi:DNA-binding beta-propeller fold protein YncE